MIICVFHTSKTYLYTLVFVFILREWVENFNTSEYTVNTLM